MAFITLTAAHSGKPVCVNTEAITVFSTLPPVDGDTNCTTLHFAGGHVDVAETTEQIAAGIARLNEREAQKSASYDAGYEAGYTSGYEKGWEGGVRAREFDHENGHDVPHREGK